MAELGTGGGGGSGIRTNASYGLLRTTPERRTAIWIVIGLVDLLVAAAAPLVDQLWTGAVALAVGAAIIATLTFFGFQAAAEPSATTSDRMRESITASVIVTYLAMVAWVTFFTTKLGADGKPLPPPALTSTMVDSFTKVVAVVVGFYFTVEVAGKVAEVFANRRDKAVDTGGGKKEK